MKKLLVTTAIVATMMIANPNVTYAFNDTNVHADVTGGSSNQTGGAAFGGTSNTNSGNIDAGNSHANANNIGGSATGNTGNVNGNTQTLSGNSANVTNSGGNVNNSGGNVTGGNITGGNVTGGSANTTGGSANVTGGAANTTGGSANTTGGSANTTGGSATTNSGNNSSSSSSNSRGGGGGQGGSANGSVTTNTSLSVNTKNEVAANTAYAPPLTASHDTCMGSSSAGGQGIGFGLSLGTTWTDDDCVRRKDAAFLHNIGLSPVALALMCQKMDVRNAVESTGDKTLMKLCNLGGDDSQTTKPKPRNNSKRELTHKRYSDALTPAERSGVSSYRFND